MWRSHCTKKKEDLKKYDDLIDTLKRTTHIGGRKLPSEEEYDHIIYSLAGKDTCSDKEIYVDDIVEMFDLKGWRDGPADSWDTKDHNNDYLWIKEVERNLKLKGITIVEV